VARYNVMFLCTGNSARSIMAEAIMNRRGGTTFTAYSAGSHPAAQEVCPHWPGQPMTAHWGIPDPAAVQGTPEAIERVYSDAFTALDRRISLFLCLPLASLDSFALQKELDDIGKK
jgi:arsenate reductase